MRTSAVEVFVGVPEDVADAGEDGVVGRRDRITQRLAAEHDVGCRLHWGAAGTGAVLLFTPYILLF